MPAWALPDPLQPRSHHRKPSGNAKFRAGSTVRLVWNDKPFGKLATAGIFVSDIDGWAHSGLGKWLLVKIQHPERPNVMAAACNSSVNHFAQAGAHLSNLIRSRGCRSGGA